MRRRLITASVMSVILAAILAGPASAGHAFAGHWVATDLDGSDMTLDIRATGPRYQVVLFDDGGSICGVFDENGNPTVPATVRGRGTADGEVLTADFVGRCHMPGAAAFFGTFSYEYDGGTDRLWDGFVFWERAS